MKLAKNDLKQLIREMMEAEEMEAEGEETEGLDFDNLPSAIYKFPSNYWIAGPERDRAEKEDPKMKEIEDHVMDGGEGIVLGKSDGRINVLVVFRYLNPFTGLDRGVGIGSEGFSGGTRGGTNLSPERALKYLKRGAELIQDEAAKSAFMSVTEKDLENMPDDTYFLAKTDKKGPKEERPKSRPSRRSGRIQADDEFFDSPEGIQMRQRKQAARYARADRRRFEEGKLTKSKLFEIIKEEISSMIQEQDIEDLHDKAVEIGSFWDKAKGQLDAVCRDPDMSPVDCKAVKTFYALLAAHPVTKAMATYNLPKARFYKHYFSVFTPVAKDLSPDSHKAQIENIYKKRGRIAKGRF